MAQILWVTEKKWSFTHSGPQYWLRTIWCNWKNTWKKIKTNHK